MRIVIGKLVSGDLVVAQLADSGDLEHVVLLGIRQVNHEQYEAMVMPIMSPLYPMPVPVKAEHVMHTVDAPLNVINLYLQFVDNSNEVEDAQIVGVSNETH